MSVGNQIGIDQLLRNLAYEPVRLQVLNLLSERIAGVGEVASELELDAGEVARELERMLEAGLVEMVGEVLRRGAVEPRYRAAVRLLWTDEEWEELALAEQRQLSSWIVQMIESDVGEALESGTFDARPDAHLSRTISRVDEQGWAEMNRILGDTVEALLLVQATSSERLAESGEEGIPALLAMVCCELPPRGPGSD